MTDGRTGALVTALAEGVRADLNEIAVEMDAVRLKIEALGDVARAINGLSGDCTGWASHLSSLLAEVRKCEGEVPAKLLGKPLPTIQQSVNIELAAQVRAAKGAA